jgi:S-DNA-T family DNA segregation ATPase FtsK/SpoIIIE
MSDYRVSDSGRILPGGLEKEFHRLPTRLAGAGLIAMAAIGWISLLTWSIGDPSLNRATDGVPSNLLGGTGASLADMLMQLLGLTSITLFLPPAAWGIALISGDVISNPRHRLAMWTLSLFLIASALSIVPKPDRWLLVHGLGGMIGDFGKGLFLQLGSVLNEKLAAIAGVAVAGSLGLATLMRACGIGWHELGMIGEWTGHHGGRRGSLMGAIFSYIFHGARHIGARIVEGRGGAQPYWQPEDGDRFTPVAVDGSFNPRFSGYERDEQPVSLLRPRIRRRQPVQFAELAPDGADRRIEPHFEIPRKWPARTVAQAPMQAPVPYAPPRPPARPAQLRHAPQPQPQVQPYREPVSYDRRANGSHAAAAYANDAFDEPAYDEAGYNEPAYEDEAVYDEPARPSPPPPPPSPPAPPAPVFRGPRPAPARRQMPDRASRFIVDHPREAPVPEPEPESDGFILPPLRLLTPPPPCQNDPELSDAALGRRAELLQGVLEDFRIKGQITGVHPGPVITLYEFEPARGTKSSRVIGLADDIARSMSAVSARVAVIPGRDAIGIELPNRNREVVYLRELLESKEFAEHKGRLQLALGKTIGGDPVIVDLARMPHLLIAGTTGSGKSVAINTMILSLLYRLTPEECRFIMIDPKMLELSVYDGIPHLLTPVVTDPHEAIKALKWTVGEMNVRYERMCKLGVRNIMGFNQKVARAQRTGEPLARTVQTGFDDETGNAIYEREGIDPTPMPFIVVVIDEMADLMMVAGKDIEFAVQRLSQMARAAGIHLIMATQRPSVDVITGTIKANFPSRISFQVTSKIDSRTILGEQGAEQLLGAGDMLTMAAGGRIMRAHGPFVADDEVESIVNFLRAQGEPKYMTGVLNDDDDRDDRDDDGPLRPGTGDEVYDQAVQIVLQDRRATTSYLQRRLGIGYNRAASLIERMEADGIISAPNRTGKREILGGEEA